MNVSLLDRRSLQASATGCHHKFIHNPTTLPAFLPLTMSSVSRRSESLRNSRLIRLHDFDAHDFATRARSPVEVCKAQVPIDDTSSTLEASRITWDLLHGTPCCEHLLETIHARYFEISRHVAALAIGPDSYHDLPIPLWCARALSSHCIRRRRRDWVRPSDSLLHLHNKRIGKWAWMGRDGIDTSTRHLDSTPRRLDGGHLEQNGYSNQ